MFEYIIPEYIDNRGDCSRIRLDGNESIADIKITAAIKGLYRDRCLDFYIIRKKCSEILSQKNIIPLYLGENEFIIPVKVREPRAMRDSLYGYVNVSFIKTVVNGCLILKDNTKLSVLDSKRSISRRIKMASILEKYFYKDEALTGELRGSLETAATREDIALVLMELKRIEKEIVRRM